MKMQLILVILHAMVAHMGGVMVHSGIHISAAAPGVFTPNASYERLQIASVSLPSDPLSAWKATDSACHSEILRIHTTYTITLVVWHFIIPQIRCAQHGDARILLVPKPSAR